MARYPSKAAEVATKRGHDLITEHMAYTVRNPKQTLLTVEASWLGPVTTIPLHRLPVDVPSSYTARTIVNRTVLDRVTMHMSEPFAVCDERGRVMFIAGTDKGGAEQRCYDMDTMHVPSRPDDGLAEQLAPEYAELLWMRAESAIAHVDSASTGRSQNVRPTAGMSRQRKAMLLVERDEELQERKRAWVLAKLISYMNRYCGVVRDVKTVVAVKSVIIEPATERRPESVKVSFKLMDPRSFVQGHAIAKLPGDKVSIGTLWFEHDNRAVYDGVGFGERLDPTTLNYYHGLAPIPLGTDAERAWPFLLHVYEVLCSSDSDLFWYATTCSPGTYSVLWSVQTCSCCLTAVRELARAWSLTCSWVVSWATTT